jgi:hypothetical protein
LLHLPYGFPTQGLLPEFFWRLDSNNLLTRRSIASKAIWSNNSSYAVRTCKRYE